MKPVKLREIDDSVNGWPQFLSARDFYVMLDASLPGTSFFSRNEDGSLDPGAQNWGEEDSRLSDIPLLEEDDNEDDSDEEDELLEDKGSSVEKVREKKLVSYDIFEKKLWPKMCKKKKDVNFHPSLVWMEIRSFIKGSYEALHTKSGRLTLDKYREIGQKRAPNFTADREAIYNLFLSYERVRSPNMFDENDLVCQLYHRLRQCRVSDWSIHKLYVDETQDFTQAELMLLIRCCSDPNGIFLTGDTAQSIMQGISFRFEDLRSLFYYVKKNYKDEEAKTQVPVPELKKLIWNYRSHSGILNLASSVVSILQEYFPESFDQLDKDQGQLDGPKPVLLKSCSPSDLAIILRGYKRKTTTIEFGAHQAILVASNNVRESLPEELSHALVLTVYEAKGLEFDDILVYNFFKDSKARIEWGTVTQYLLNVSKSETGNSVEVKSRPVPFDPDQHKLLKAELKQLYTAVTRARANVWFFDEDEENRRPVFEYFEQLGLAEVVSLEAVREGSTSENQPLEKIFPKGSSLMEWQNQGDFFYSKKLWKVAEKCYTNSGDDDMRRKCKAYAQADYALNFSKDPQRQKDEFLRAAYQFLQCKMIRQTKACLYNAWEHSLFASLLQKLGKERKAAIVFERNGHFLSASQCLEATADYRGAVDALVRGSLYSKAIEVVKRFRKLTSEEQKLTNPPGRTLDELYLDLAEFSFRRGDTAGMSSSLQHVESTDTRIAFLMKHRLLEDAAKELEKLGRSGEVANIMRENGSFLIAAKYAQRSGNSVLAADCIFAHARVSNAMTDEEQQKCLEEAKQLYEGMEKKKNSLGEVLLRQAKLSRDEKKVLRAMEIFSDPSVSNTCSNLECIEILSEMVGDDLQILDQKKFSWTLVKLVENVIKLILSLDIPDPDFKTQKALERCEEHFGIYREGDPKTRLVRLKEGDRFLSISLDWKRETPAGSKWRLHFRDVRTRIAENLLDRITSLIPKVRNFLKKEIVSHKTCQMFLVGMPCSDENCQYQHCLPTDQSTDTLFWALSHEVYLDAQVNDLFKLEEIYSSHETSDSFEPRMPLSTSSKKLGKLFPKDPYQSCRSFLQFFFSPIGISSRIRSRKYIQLVRDEKFIQQSLYKCVDTLWKNQLNRQERISDINCFLTVSNLLQLLGLPPSTILSVVTLWDAFNCTTQNHFENFRAVELFRFSPTTMVRVQSLLRDMVSLMLGGSSPKFNVLERVLNTQSCIDSGETERTVIMVLTMLCNCGQLLPKQNEIILLRNLFAQVPDEGILPERISSCLKQVRQAKGLREIVAILQDLLRNRKEELCDVYWRSRTVRMYDVNFNGYLDSFNTDTDTLSTLIQETADPLGDDALEPEEEYGPHVEEDQPTSDLDPSSNSMVHDIEREEAMQEELWKKEMTTEMGEHAKVDYGQAIRQDDIPTPFVNVKVDKSGCGFCNVFFSDQQTRVEGNLERVNESGHSEFFINDIESHLSPNSPHWKKLEQFNAYKSLIIQQVVPHHFTFETLVKKVEDQLEIAGKQNMPLSILSNRLNEVQMTYTALREVTSTIQREGNWAETTPVEEAVRAFLKASQACQEELLKESQPRDDDPMNSTKDVEDVEDSEYLHVPGLKKRKN
ncbi:TPR and ankyrin repeat-containing protein 1-like [Stylophora pistillata]|uniref:TPR and ankyrin repeat-containing protein 1-like n=1 Tax=Stylophora pistillata TaxID=50429 RepID=UPI000C04DA7D|nr:TPR and ankyrin repeat-containing protein 1-like [Stylophora pistillata]